MQYLYNFNTMLTQSSHSFNAILTQYSDNINIILIKKLKQF